MAVLTVTRSALGLTTTSNRGTIVRVKSLLGFSRSLNTLVSRPTSRSCSDGVMPKGPSRTVEVSGSAVCATAGRAGSKSTETAKHARSNIDEDLPLGGGLAGAGA